MTNMEYYAQWLSDLIKKDKNVYLLIIDGWENYLFDKNKDDMTDEQKSRIINMGISEQNAVGFAAGLALGGKKVYVFMFAAFLTSRAAEQIKLDVTYNNADVTFIGIHGGVTGPRIAGYSHWALEDIATLNGYPNIKIFAPSNNEQEIKACLKYSVEHKGPVYIRLENPGINVIKTEQKVQIGKLSFLRFHRNPQFIIISYGEMTNKIIPFLEKLDKMKYRYIFCSAFSLKPFDYDGFAKILKRNIPIIALEEHSRYGGLCSIVAEEIASSNTNVHFKSINVSNQLFNSVYASDSSIYYLFNGNPIEQILSAIETKTNFCEKTFRFIKRKIDHRDRLCICYTLLGIPVLTKKILKNNDISYYVFGIKILRKKCKV
ncbi:MAG: hypothetical protein J6X42_01370 [Alphaproteobacteria bacterium]|nr:hypothetical protein [Alphaproteobacteria bacterium]